MTHQAITEAVYYILLSLMKPLHGYGIMQNVEQLSNGRVKLAAGTLYGAINTLLEKGWITAAGATSPAIGLSQDKGNRKKEYLITERGKEMLQAEISHLQELLENGTRIMKEQ
ncbi:MAG: helix-turn-helix transcriptional regulator [Lachnospiraceae bacterium]|nr:helix-turn-helix transcriptional regulator [Lachnospiraceae bacterium]